ncbi:hypothetical protein H4219_006253, partial [Mycoemilia scoparia]
MQQLLLTSQSEAKAQHVVSDNEDKCNNNGDTETKSKGCKVPNNQTLTQSLLGTAGTIKEGTASGSDDDNNNNKNNNSNIVIVIQDTEAEPQTTTTTTAPSQNFNKDNKKKSDPNAAVPFFFMKNSQKKLLKASNSKTNRSPGESTTDSINSATPPNTRKPRKYNKQSNGGKQKNSSSLLLGITRASSEYKLPPPPPVPIVYASKEDRQRFQAIFQNEVSNVSRNNTGFAIKTELLEAGLPDSAIFKGGHIPTPKYSDHARDNGSDQSELKDSKLLRNENCDDIINSCIYDNSSLTIGDYFKTKNQTESQIGSKYIEPSDSEHANINFCDHLKLRKGNIFVSHDLPNSLLSQMTDPNHRHQYNNCKSILSNLQKKLTDNKDQQNISDLVNIINKDDDTSPPTSSSSSSMLFVDQYQPKCVSDMIGQESAGILAQLIEWLESMKLKQSAMSEIPKSGMWETTSTVSTNVSDSEPGQSAIIENIDNSIDPGAEYNPKLDDSDDDDDFMSPKKPNPRKSSARKRRQSADTNGLNADMPPLPPSTNNTRKSKKQKTSAGITTRKQKHSDKLKQELRELLGIDKNSNRRPKIVRRYARHKPTPVSSSSASSHTTANSSNYFSGIDYFYDFEDKEFSDSDTSHPIPKFSRADNNLALLVGPPGCGKTAAVYACASQCGYQVHELHPGNKRRGQDIMAELEELIQTHVVVGGGGSSSSNNNNSNNRNNNSGDGIRTKSLFDFQKPSSSTTTTATTSTSSTSTTHEKQQILILIEQIDVLFDVLDQGMWNSLRTLASKSKRPIIATCNDFELVQRQIVQQNSSPAAYSNDFENHGNPENSSNSFVSGRGGVFSRIWKLSSPNVNEVESYLYMLALDNGIVFKDTKQLGNLYKQMKCDLRRTMNQLDFLCRLPAGYPYVSKKINDPEEVVLVDIDSAVTKYAENSIVDLKTNQLPQNPREKVGISVLVADMNVPNHNNIMGSLTDFDKPSLVDNNIIKEMDLFELADYFENVSLNHLYYSGQLISNEMIKEPVYTTTWASSFTNSIATAATASITSFGGGGGGGNNGSTYSNTNTMNDNSGNPPLNNTNSSLSSPSIAAATAANNFSNKISDKILGINYLTLNPNHIINKPIDYNNYPPLPIQFQAYFKSKTSISALPLPNNNNQQQHYYKQNLSYNIESILNNHTNVAWEILPKLNYSGDYLPYLGIMAIWDHVHKNPGLLSLIFSSSTNTIAEDCNGNDDQTNRSAITTASIANLLLNKENLTNALNTITTGINTTPET